MQDSESTIGPNADTTCRLDLDQAALELSQAVGSLVTDRLTGRATDGFRVFGVGMEEIDRAMVAIEPTVRRSVWSMQPLNHFDPASTSAELGARSRERDLDLRFLTTLRSLELYPLILSEVPEVHFGPAPSQFLLIDDAVGVVGGPLSEHGYLTAWLATRTDILDRMRAIWHEAWRRSVPGVPEGAQPPFTARQCLVARRLTLGAKDAAIARELGVSVRTVAADVAHLMRTLGAGSRAEASLMLVGRSRRLDLERLRPR